MKKLQSLGRVSTVLAIAATTTFLSVKPAKAVSVTINFDEFTNNQIIPGNTFISQGVVFDQSLQIVDASIGALPSSSPLAAANNDSFAGSLSGFFTGEVDSISVFAGDNGGDIDNITLVGLDDSNNTLASDNFSNDTAQTLSISGSGITKFQINSTNLFGIDDFTFNTSASASVPFEFSPTLGLLLAGSLFGVSRYAKSRKAAKLIDN